MTTCRASVSGGAWLRCLSVPVLGLSLLAGPACVAETAAFAVPEALQTALGWKELPGGNYQPYRTGSAFAVGSEPAQWPAAREQAAAWAAGAPKLAESPADFVMRKLARIEALALNATDKGALDELRAESKALGETAQALRALKPADGNDWQTRSVSEQLVQLQGSLGKWLSESPADRVAAFREAMAAYRPKERAELIKRYGGEERLAELIKMGQELNRLNAAFQAAEEDTTTPEPQRKLAMRKAAGALGYFYGYHGQDNEWQAALNDPDLKTEISDGEGGEDNDYRSLNVPELLSWVNEDEAVKLLAEAYSLPVAVELQAGSRTGALASRLIIEGKLTPKRVPWSLVGWRGDVVNGATAGDVVALYDVLKKQFPALTEKKQGGNGWRQESALGALPVALAVAGRMDEAAALAGKDGLGSSALPYHARLTEDAAAAAWTLALRVSGNTHTEGSWSSLSNLAGLAKRSGELTAFAAKQAAEAPAGSEKAKIWQARHGWALIGEEKIDEGLALLTPLLEAKPAAGEKEWAALWPGSVRRLLNLAIILPRPELAKAWSEKLAVEFKTPTGLVWGEGGNLFDTFAARELKAGNFALIEEILRGRLAVKPKPPTRRIFSMVTEEEAMSEPEDRVNPEEVTKQLADVLARQGRHADVLTLLSESPHFNQRDLAQVLDNGSGGGAWRPLPLVVAESLAGAGRKDEAVAVLEAYLISRSGYDPAYALYTNVRGQDAAPFLEKLWAADHYEERPLIWLATLQLAAGKTAEAEATIKRAIATDPSDGEQPKGDRMRAYAVMREIELKKGNAKQAEFFAGVLAAIRASEDADDIAEAGLMDRAIKGYERALESFSDAYCIQSRLARRLAEENRMPEAMEHYKRAFELMPDSFGRVESHCFGCEQAFAGEDAQAVAERVFKEMAAKPDAKPQVQYLLGYLRMEQDRWDEAADYFSKAVAADPEYLNAWKKLASVLPNSSRPRAEQDAVAFRLLALDPAGKHGGAGEENVRDLPALWRAYAAAGESGLSAPKTLYPLGEKSKKAKSMNRSDEHSDYGRHRRGGGTPAERLAKHNVLEAVTQALDGAYQWQARSE